MNDLLKKTKVRIHEKLTYLPMRSADERAVYITTGRTIPRMTAFPAIALKDGSTDHKLIGGTLSPGAVEGEYDGVFDDDMNIHVTGFVQIFREEDDLITGDGKEKGIVELMDDVLAALTGWLPGTAYNYPLIPIRTEQSQIFEDIQEPDPGSTFMVQSKEIIFACAKQR